MADDDEDLLNLNLASATVRRTKRVSKVIAVVAFIYETMKVVLRKS